MDTALIIATTGIFVGIVAVLFGIFGLMWQMNRQSSRLETKIEEQGKELRDEMKEQGKELRDEMKEQGKRVSQAELDQARLNGVNSVLLSHTHTHESPGSAD